MYLVFQCNYFPITQADLFRDEYGTIYTKRYWQMVHANTDPNAKRH